MKIVKPGFVIEDEIDGALMLKKLEKAGRTCYKSEEKAEEGSAERFIRALIRRGHESVLEHEKISVRFVCDRGVTHEMVRHRIASYSQESTRYCNYSDGKFGCEITVIEPCFFEKGSEAYALWEKAMLESERAYTALIEGGATAQEARSVLPNSLKTEIVATMNLREWRHFFRMRTASDAHPQIREVALPLLSALREKIPVVFDDLSAEESPFAPKGGL